MIHCNREWHPWKILAFALRPLRGATRCCHLATIVGSCFRHYVTEGFGVRKVGERREEENGRRGYGKRAGTSCEVRVARHEIASFAIDRAKKGRRTSAGEGPTTSLAVASRVPPSKPHRQELKPVSSPAVTCRRSLSSVLRLGRFKKALAG